MVWIRQVLLTAAGGKQTRSFPFSRKPALRRPHECLPLSMFSSAGLGESKNGVQSSTGLRHQKRSRVGGVELRLDRESDDTATRCGNRGRAAPTIPVVQRPRAYDYSVGGRWHPGTPAHQRATSTSRQPWADIILHQGDQGSRLPRRIAFFSAFGTFHRLNASPYHVKDG
jgi:hypothetical protein